MSLPDEVLVYPAHGAGSLCGRNMRAERSSTIGTERLTNYALQIAGKEKFVHELTSNLPARPEYFSQDAEINRQGAPALAALPELPAISAVELRRLLDEDVIALDVRPNDQFAAGHVPGSVNIALSGQFASWAGAMLGLSSQPVLIADTDEQISEARMRLARIGLEGERGYLMDGVKGWLAAGFEMAQLPQITPHELSERLQQGGIDVLDVRREPEFVAGHIEGANWWPLDRFKLAPPEIDLSRALAVHCKSGYRSMIACSLLERAGFRNLINLRGGLDGWQQAGLPVEVEKPVLA
jgi:rhodanese-related sulfurtransferase